MISAGEGIKGLEPRLQHDYTKSKWRNSPVLAQASRVLGQAFRVDHAAEQPRLVVRRGIFDGDQHRAGQALDPHTGLHRRLRGGGHLRLRRRNRIAQRTLGILWKMRNRKL